MFIGMLFFEKEENEKRDVCREKSDDDEGERGGMRRKG